jgi:hypothetical protein
MQKHVPYTQRGRETKREGRMTFRVSINDGVVSVGLFLKSFFAISETSISDPNI